MILLTAALLLGACSPDEHDQAKQNDNVWKSQTDTIGQAKSAVNKLNAAQGAEQKATDDARNQ